MILGYAHILYDIYFSICTVVVVFSYFMRIVFHFPADRKPIVAFNFKLQYWKQYTNKNVALGIIRLFNVKLALYRMLSEL